MSALVNTYGRTFDDLDAMKMHVHVRDFAAQAGAASFSVVADDGTPMCGFVAAEGGPSADFVARGWNRTAGTTTEGKA